MGNQQTTPVTDTPVAASDQSSPSPDDKKSSTTGHNEVDIIDEKTTKLKSEGWNDLREKKRWCTDSLFLLLLIGCWIGTTIFGLVAIGAIESESLESGNPGRLTNVMDYRGNICGIDDGFKSLRYGFYLPDSSAICIEHCPLSNDFDKFFCRYNLQKEADDSVVTGYEFVAQQRCMYAVKTREFLNRCIPDTDLSNAAKQAAAAYEDALNIENNNSSSSSGTGDDDIVQLLSQTQYDDESSGGSWFNLFIADLQQLYGYIIGFGVIVSALIGFCYLWLLQVPGLLFTLVWETIVAVGVLLAVAAYFLWAQANSWHSNGLHSDPEIFTMRFFAYLLMVLTVLYALLILVLRKRIQLAIGIIKQASRALSQLPLLLLLPVLQALGLLLFLVPWVIYAVYLASSGTVTVREVSFDSFSFNDDNSSSSSSSGDDDDSTYRYRTFEYKDNTRYAFLFLVFSCLWTSEFILSLGQIIIALSFAAWYFTRDKSQFIGSNTVLWSFKTAAVFHAGTAAHGALIIAIIRAVRALLSYIQRRVNRSGSSVAKYIICCCRCCFWCLEKIMRFINKNAYILTAIYGYSFCTAARKAFFLLLRNILRVAAVNLISGFLLFIGKIFIPVATTCLCYLAVAYTVESDDVSGIVAPLVFTFLLSYWIAAMFLDIFSMGIDTILLCFIADEEMFEPEKRFATGDLMSTLQQTALKAAQAKIAKQQIQAAEQPLPAGYNDADSGDDCCNCCCVGGSSSSSNSEGAAKLAASSTASKYAAPETVEVATTSATS